MKIPNYISLRSKVEALNRQFDRRKEDKFFEREGGRILYALDNDVITLITAPWRIEPQYFLCDLIESDPETPESLAYVLASYFLSHRLEAPYIIVHPAENELEGVWNHVYELAKDEQEELHAGLDSILSSFPKQASLNEERSLFELVRRVLDSVYGRGGPITELERISTLIESGNVRRMETIVDADGSSPFPYEASENDSILRGDQNKWLEQLNRIRPMRKNRDSSSYHPSNNLVDAAVLAKIYWVNCQYKQNNINTRLCLITGDSHIERVASQRDFFGISFSNLFIRKPDCFLADSDFFNKARVDAPDFLNDTDSINQNRIVTFRDWLNITFPEGTTSQIEFESKKNESAVVSEISAAISQWSRYLRSAASSSRITDDEFNDTINKYILGLSHLHIEEVRRDFEVLKNRLRVIATDAISRFGGSSALAGFWSLNPQYRDVKRSIPGIKFDSLEKAADLAEQLKTSGSFRQLQRRVDRKWLLDLRHEDKSGYSTFIIFSLAFALAGEWSTALTIAKTAVSIASQSRETELDSTIKGDEAAYLCAIFSRLCAETLGDLDECKYWIKEAERLQKIPPIRKILINIDIQTYKDPRFAAEELAIHITKRWFILFGTDQESSLSKQLLPIKYPILDECLEHIRVFRLAQKEPVPHVRQYICEQLSVNFLQLQIAAKAEDNSEILLPKEAHRFLQELKTGSLDKISIPTAAEEEFTGYSHLVYFVYLCGTALFDPPSVGWNDRDRKQTLLRQLEENGRKLRLTPYDEARAKFFVDIVKNSLEQE